MSLPVIEEHESLDELATRAKTCRACPLWRLGTQTVFGEGPTDAALFIVGEQPGDQEDYAGHPFVGPAGLLLDRALEEAGIARNRLYLTIAVKHFKWMFKGKRRVHKPPTQSEIEACLPWLAAELGTVKPRIILCLGATAARAVMQAPIRVTEFRGQTLHSPYGIDTLVTMHPAYVLRLRSQASEAAYTTFAHDIRQAATMAGML